MRRSFTLCSIVVHAVVITAALIAQVVADGTLPTPHRPTIFDALPKLAPRADALFRINVKAQEQGTVRFRVQMTSTNLTEAVIKEEATRIYSDAPEGKSTPSPSMQPPSMQPQPVQPGQPLSHSGSNMKW